MTKKNDDEFDAPESSSVRKLIEHIIDEMPPHVVIAVFMVAFLFFYGMAGSLFALTGRNLSTLDFPLGLVCGAVGAVVTTALILRVKYRRK